MSPLNHFRFAFDRAYYNTFQRVTMYYNVLHLCRRQVRLQGSVLNWTVLLAFPVVCFGQHSERQINWDDAICIFDFFFAMLGKYRQLGSRQLTQNGQLKYKLGQVGYASLDK